ncbi:MAG TPA: preprotein translocase subunit SecG [Pirellulales bacterium]|nr:preprotein translocase subunit SecG [Pirellulales bacterium]
MEILIKVAMFLVALFLIVLILLQRGRGGGLAGALGGMGGQSAFGTKAGDMFTRITSGLALFWILLCVVAVKYQSQAEDRFDAAAGAKATAGEEALEPQPGETKPGKAGRAPSGEKTSAMPAGSSDKSAGGKSKPAESKK